MNLELGRSVGSNEVSPFFSPGEQILDAKPTCSSSLRLVLKELAKRGLRLSLSPSRVVFTVSRQTDTVTEVLPQSPSVRRSGALGCCSGLQVRFG